jgi:hypothetical protein
MSVLPTIPLELKQLFEGGDYPKSSFARVNEAAVLLVTDTRMAKCWETLAARADPGFRDANGGWAESFVHTSARQYLAALGDQRRWMKMTSAAQARWRENLEVAIGQLRELIAIGPNPMALGELVLKTDYDEYELLREHWATGISAEVLEGARNCDFELPIHDKFFWGIPTYELHHLLDRVLEDQIGAAAGEFRQTLKKPRDRGAGRIRFLQDLTMWCKRACGAKLQEVVATTGAVLFDDDAINVRLVQTHTRHL